MLRANVGGTRMIQEVDLMYRQRHHPTSSRSTVAATRRHWLRRTLVIVAACVLGLLPGLSRLAPAGQAVAQAAQPNQPQRAAPAAGLAGAVPPTSLRPKDYPLTSSSGRPARPTSSSTSAPRSTEARACFCCRGAIKTRATVRPLLPRRAARRLTPAGPRAVRAAAGVAGGAQA
jgi:hypothetical protein